MENIQTILSLDGAAEDVSRREANVKHFCLDGNRRQAISYSANVHFRDAQGRWADIDNTLESVMVGGREMLRNRANAVSMLLPRRMNAGSEVSVSRNGKTFSWRFEQADGGDARVFTGAELKKLRLAHLAQKLPRYVGRTLESLLNANLAEELETPVESRMAPMLMCSEARYEQICPGVSVRYSLNGERLKEDILIDNADALNRAVIRLSDAFDYCVSEDGELLVCDRETGEIEFMMGVPIVYDANDRFTRAQVQLEDGVRMRYALDAEWLNAAAFPVTIDPVVITKVEDEAIEDAYIWKKYADSNFGKAHLMRCGIGEGGESISLIRFKTLVNQRASDTILSAQLRTIAFAYPSKTEYFGCYPIKTPWTETGVTWNGMSPDNAEHIGSELLCYVTGTNSACYFDITNLYRSWYQKDENGDSRNFGVALRYCGKSNASDKYVEWYAAKYDSESAYGPCMIVNYVSHAGCTPWGTYESMNAGRAGAAHADLYNGNLVYTHSDIAGSGARMPVSVGHVYNSCLSASNPVGCGMGWRTTMHHSLIQKSYDFLSYYIWTDGNGTEHYFRIDGAQPYTDMEGMNLKLNAGDTGITIEDKQHNVMTFPAANGETPVWIASLSDSCGNAMRFTYLADGRLQTIEDGAGLITQFAYDDSGALISISAPGCPHVNYAYEDEKLTQITYSDVESGGTTFAYQTDSALLESAQDFTGVRIGISYEAPGSYDAAAIDQYSVQACRVLSLEQSAGALAGAKKNFDYRHMTTRVTAVRDAESEHGKTITYQFNDGGNVVGMYDELGFAQYSAFSASIPNQQTSASKLQGTVINLLRGVDFSANWEGEALNVDSVTRKLGLPSLKLIQQTASQTVQVSPDETYTFSAFVRTEAGSRALLRMTCGEQICESRVHEGDWERLFVTIQAPEGASAATVELISESGTAWFSAPQMEKGSIPNRVNLLSNGNFARTVQNAQRPFPEDWIAGDGAASTSADNGVLLLNHGMPETLTGGAMRMYSNVTDYSVCINQTLNVRGEPGDTFVLGGWLNARSVANQHPLFAYRFHNADENAWTGWVGNECSSEWVGWQFACFAIAADVNYDQIEISINYGGNAQFGLFSNIFLHREQFGESFAYDDKKNLISTSTLSGEKSGMEYDDFDNLIRYIAPGAEASEAFALTYGDTDDEKKKHLLRSETSPSGVNKTYTYDAFGNPVSSRVQGEGAFIASETAWQNGNYPISSTDARGNAVEKTVDPETGLVQSVTDPAGQTVNYTYDTSRRVTGVETSADGKTYKNAYTYENDRVKTVAHNTDGDVPDVIYSFEYDALGRKTKVKVGAQTLSENVYHTDRSGLLKEVRYGNGGKVRYAYDEFDRPTQVFLDDSAQPQCEYEYGANGQASFVRDNRLNRKLQTEYDLSERPCQTTLRDAQTDALIYRTTLEYDRRSRLKSFREQTADGAHETTFAYDADSRPKRIEFDGEALEYAYDSLGRLASRKIGTVETQYEYLPGDENHYGAGASTNLVKKITQNGMNFEYAYDNRGNIVSEKRGELTTTYAYDALGQLIRVNDPYENATWVYNYDRGGNILSKVKYAYTEGELGEVVENIPYEYTDSNWKDKLTAYNGKTITYDAIGNPLNDGERQYEWEAGRRLKKLIVKSDPAEGIEEGFDEGSATSLKLEFSNGNLLMGETSNTVISAKVYRKDVDVTDEYAATAFNWTRTSGNESADASWNAAHSGMKSITVSANELTDDIQIQCTLTGTSPAYGSVDVNDSFIASHTRGAADSNDTFSLEDGTLFVTTDDDNYRLSDNELTALYPRLNGSVTANAWVYHAQPTKTIEFKYNSAGLRVQKKVTANGKSEATDYTLHGKLVTHMTVGNDKLHFFYDAQSRPTKVNFNGTTYTYLHNLQGDIVGILDNTGNLVVEYKYDAWGRSIFITGSLADTLGKCNPFRYRGYVYDEESELYYLRSRYYILKVGRFVNGDSIVMTGFGASVKNMYAYCQNSPALFKDTNGCSAMPAVQDIPKSIVYVRNPNPNDPQSLPRIYYYKDVDEKVYDYVKKGVNIASIFIPWGKIFKAAGGVAKGIKGFQTIANSKVVKTTVNVVAAHPKISEYAAKGVAASQEWWDISLGSIAADIFVGKDGWTSEYWNPYSPYLDEDKYYVIYECEIPNIEPTTSRGTIPSLDSFS